MPESSKPAEPVQKKPHEKTLENDKRFGKALQNKGYITPYQFERVSARQQRYVKSGKLVRLSTILLKREMISYEHAEEAFELIGEPRKFCRACGCRYRPNTDRRICPKCNSPYPAPEIEIFDTDEMDSVDVKAAEAVIKKPETKKRKFGKFIVLDRLGQGGMGAVYKAHDTVDDIDVALKIMLPWLAKKSEFRDRFLVEVSALKKIKHPNTVFFYESGEINGMIYCAMELLSGKDLEARLDEEDKLPTDEVIRILRDVTGVLDYGYSRFAPGKFVHRDIKPGNIFACDDGSYRLMDFGLVRSRILFGKSLTEKGDVFGTISYMSPEQIGAEGGIDIRSDIYSLGSTAYHLVTGDVPYEGERMSLVIKKINESRPTPIKSLVPDIPKHFAVCIKKMMAADPEDRYQTPAELLEELEKL
ncbi:MAG: hypothetical protein E3J72_19545 [Planctomycetota bacterium]|nr:MAG: hypothetical protein E3J72_19545 [Planctomycetota bacterium]